MLQIKLTNLNK